MISRTSSTNNVPKLRRKVWLLWWVTYPVSTPLFGSPGRRLGMVGDLPRNVIRQWRTWCLQPDYAAGDGPAVRELYESVTTPITAFSFPDDEMMSEERRLTPDEVGVERVGHFGAFRDTMRGPLWKGRIRRHGRVRNQQLLHRATRRRARSKQMCAWHLRAARFAHWGSRHRYRGRANRA